MTEAMPFLQKAILLSYAPGHLGGRFFSFWDLHPRGTLGKNRCFLREKDPFFTAFFRFFHFFY